MKSLVIIGNGFDLGHNLPTSIDNFIKSNSKFEKKYQKLKGENWNELESNFKELLSTIMSDREYVDIEEELDEILDTYGYDEYGFIDYVPIPSNKYTKEINEIEELVVLITDFENDFLKYLSVNCSNNKLKNIIPRNKILNILKSSSYIINFNYTHVIEEVYHIKNIEHIHGSLNKKNITIGIDAVEELKESLIDSTYPTERPCNNKFELQERMRYYIEDMEGQLHEDESVKSIFSEIRKSVEENEHKLFKSIDKKNKETLSSRQRIKDRLKKEKYDSVFILGHSLGEADMSVFKQINSEAKIYCYYYEYMNDSGFQTMKENLHELDNDFELIPNDDLYDIQL